MLLVARMLLVAKGIVSGSFLLLVMHLLLVAMASNLLAMAFVFAFLQCFFCDSEVAAMLFYSALAFPKEEDDDEKRALAGAPSSSVCVEKKRY